MAEKMDMSLDDIIATNKKGSGGGGGGRGGSRGGGRGMSRGGGGGRGARRGGPPNRMDRSRSNSQGRNYPRGNPDGQWDHDMYNGGGAGAGRGRSMSGGVSTMNMGGTGKLLVSNLDFGVSESDIHELFSEFGNLKLATVHYDRSGRSLGTAEVSFDRRSDAVKALKQYNGVPLDGRPMRIEIAGSERDMASSAPIRRVSGGSIGRRTDMPRRPSSGGGRGAPRGGRGGRGAGGGRGGKREEKPTKSKEDLDAEMEAYMKTKE